MAPTPAVPSVPNSRGFLELPTTAFEERFELKLMLVENADRVDLVTAGFHMRLPTISLSRVRQTLRLQRLPERNYSMTITDV